VAELFRSTHESYMGVSLKRLMLQAAEKIADDMNIDVLLTGESVAQVSSQTLRNLALIDQATTKLVLRPLSTMHKPDIIKIANDIGTRHFAENMPEYCGVISQNPVISGSFKRMEKESSRFDMTVLEKAIEDAVSIPVHSIIEDINEAQVVEVITKVTSEEIIDIRKQVEVERFPLDKADHIVPFHQLNQAFKKMDQSKQYLLYCEKGVMSQLHAQYLRDAGFENVRVYRPE